ncbi:MAG: FAD-dependent oxidoreductase, partial [Bacteroidota bacterium]
MVEPVVIVGAGLSGLTSAYVLWQHNIPSLILEARDRIGGRIFTERSDSFHTEMGATWLGPQHTVLISLLEQLEVTKFVQSYDGKSIVDYGPSHPPYFFSSNPGDPPTYRIVNGSATLIDHLLKVSSPKLSLGSEVKSIKYLGDTVLIITDEDQFEAEFLVNTIPPKLTRRSISFEPELNDDVLKKMEETHTWMSNSIKFSVRYKEPFWRSQGLSGCIMSQGGA